MKKRLFTTLFSVFWLFNCQITAQITNKLQLFFATDSFRISTLDEEKLKLFIKNTDTVTVAKISILGYCDDIGDTEKNKLLSEKRARFASDLLVHYNLKKEVIEVCEGKGELPLFNKTDIEKERAQNRRIDIEITCLKKEKPQITINEIKPPEIEKVILSDNQKVGDIIILENILFVGNRHVLLPESYDDLLILNKLLLEKKKYHVCILGHICCIEPGSDGVDLDTGIKNLSVARAKVIYDYLIKNGVDEKRISYKGLKSDFPTGKGPKQDRRVEIQITKIISD